MRFVTKTQRISGCTSPTQRTWSGRGDLCKLPVRRPHVTHDLAGRRRPRPMKLSSDVPGAGAQQRLFQHGKFALELG